MRIEDAQGSVTVPGAVVTQIVVAAAESVEGARVRRPRRGLDVDLDAREVSLELTARLGSVLPDLAREVQERVTGALRTMLGVEPRAVNVSVEELE